jgi:hypothetical protein
MNDLLCYLYQPMELYIAKSEEVLHIY